MAQGLSCSAAHGSFPDQGSNLCPHALAGRFLTTVPPGKSQKISGIYLTVWSFQIPATSNNRNILFNPPTFTKRQGTVFKIIITKLLVNLDFLYYFIFLYNICIQWSYQRYFITHKVKIWCKIIYSLGYFLISNLL